MQILYKIKISLLNMVKVSSISNLNDIDNFSFTVFT